MFHLSLNRFVVRFKLVSEIWHESLRSVYKKAALSQGNRTMPPVRLIPGIFGHAQNLHISISVL